MEEQVQNVKTWIEEKPHNEEIIPFGQYCRAAHFVDTLTPNHLKLMNLAYGDNLNQNEIAEFFSRASERALMDSIRKKDEMALAGAIIFGALAAYHTSLEDASSNRGIILSMFGRSLLIKWQKTPTSELLDQTIEYFRKAITHGPQNGLYRDVHFLDLGQQLRERFKETHSPEDFVEASHCLEMAVKVNPRGAPIVSLAWARLNQEKNEINRTEAKQILDEYIGTLSKAVQAIPEDFNPSDYRESLSSVYWHLGVALARRFDLTKAKADCQSAEGAFCNAKTAAQHGKNDNRRACLELGRLKLTKFTHTGGVESAKAAYQYLKEALEIQPESTDAMELLGELYRLQANHTGSGATVSEAIQLLSHCIEAAGSMPSYVLLLRAANAYGTQYKFFGKREVIDRAIELLFQATRGDSLPSDGNMTEGHCMLANFLLMRFEKTEDEEDLATALSIIDEADNEELDGPTRNDYLRTRGRVLFTRYQSRTLAADLVLAIETYQKAVEIPDAGASLYNAYNDLGNTLLDKYRATGDTQSLLTSAKYYDTALKSLKSGRWRDDIIAENMLLHGLANTQYLQFEVSQRLSDIDTAIACYQQCFDATPPDHFIRLSRAGSLAWALQKRFDLTKQLEDAQKSQAVLLEVLDFGFSLTPHHISNLYNNLGSAYLRCYVSNNEPSYLDHAAEHYQKALASGCKIPSYIRTATLNLSMVYRCKAKHSKDLVNMTLAIKLFGQLIQTIGIQGEQDPQYEITLFNMAELMFTFFELPGIQPSHLLVDMFMKLVPSFARFKRFPRHIVAQIYVRLAIVRFQATSQAAEPLQLVRAAAEELPGSILLQSLNRGEQLKVIGTLSNVPSLAILFSIMAGESAQSALQLFEASRSVLWDNILAQKLNDQKSSMLHAYPKLELQFENLRQTLSKYGNVDTILDPTSTGVLWQGEQFSQAMSYNKVLDEIRSKPGLENFLRLPRDLPSLQKYAREGPIIIVNGNFIRSDAIIIRNDDIFSINLPLFTEPIYQEMRLKQTEALKSMAIDLEKSNQLLEAVLKTLWTVVAEPILEFLGFRGEQRDNDTLPRVWWLTTGWIGNLPIHAAGDHKAVLATGARLSVTDRTVSSYIGNIRALDYLRGRQNPSSECNVSQSQERRALLVKMPTTPNMLGGDLPNAEREIEAAYKIFEKAGFRTKALDKPNTAAVLRMGKGADLVHFACHGISSDGDPAESMLRLADWKSRPLSVGELLKTNDLSCQLIYLSACETALNRLRPLEDEGLHLAGGFQMAGAVNVVASLWRVDDSMSVDVATSFYAGLDTSSGIDFSKCALSLRETVSKMRAKGFEAVLWASYVHLGP